MNEEFFKLTGVTIDLIIGLGISIGIGLLIGLERQFNKVVKENEEQLGGIRTYTMLSMLGFLSAFLASEFGQWLFAVSLFCMFAFLGVVYIQLSEKQDNRGSTSEIAAIITFLLGAVVFLKYILLALIVMVVVLVLLAFKPTLHSFVRKLTSEELRAIIQFVIMSALVLPFLPDKNFGPYDLWNLKEIWKMVVLVSGTSLVGYLVAKIVGSKGTLLAGMVGGLVSSTSVALTFSRKSREASGASSFYFAMGILSACTIMFPRILFEVYVVNPRLATQLWVPVLILSVAGFGSAFLIYKIKKGKAGTQDLVLKNPLEFSTAIKFALFYAGIQWLVKFSSEKFGDNGTYVAGALSGITDVDAITLSMAKMATDNSSALLAINTILIAALSNTIVKFIIVLSLGSMDLRKTAIIGFSSIFFAGVGYFIYDLFNK
jgi:uncharacterized membrane protein (DUF4010 family)